MHEIKTKCGYIPIASDITQIPPNEIAKEFQTELWHLNLEKLDPENELEEIPIFYFILTGGTEQKVLNLWNKRKEIYGNEPIILLAHPGNNSLPASLEILARLQQTRVKGKIIYINGTSETWNEISKSIKHFNVYNQLKKTKIGLIGDSSDWLIASMPEFETIRNIWGPEVIKIDLEVLKNKIKEITDEEIEEAHYQFTSRSSETKEPSKKEIKNVVKVYAALKNIIKENNLSAISIRCFDLVTDLKTTGCFALAQLNDEGIIAGCEGDLVSTLGMIWANYLTDQAVWMANPAKIDEQNNSLWLAHCTVPIGMVEKYKLRSHFESGIGVGIEGQLSKGKATLFRIGGKDLKKSFISNAEILESGSEENLCRTQVNVKLHGSYKVSDILLEPLGNHLLLMRGSYTKEMIAWLEMFIN
jgi:L-fucose isomerase-like protein